MSFRCVAPEVDASSDLSVVDRPDVPIQQSIKGATEVIE